DRAARGLSLHPAGERHRGYLSMPINSLALRIFASVLLTFGLTIILVLAWQQADRATNLVHLEERSITRVSVAATKLLATVESPAERQAFIENINAVLPLHIG